MKVKLLNSCGYRSIKNLDFPVIVNATLEDGSIMIKYSEFVGMTGFNTPLASLSRNHISVDIGYIGAEILPEYVVNDASYIEGIRDTELKQYLKFNSSKGSDPKYKPVFILENPKDPFIDKVVVQYINSYDNKLIEKDIVLCHPLIEKSHWGKFMVLKDDFVPHNPDSDIEVLRRQIKELMSAVEEATLIKEEAKNLYKTDPDQATKLFKKAGKTVTPIKSKVYLTIETIEKDIK
ncbi:hypothetical protein Pm5461_211 [Proteus phage vB_PmiM_Pm5461]|uniref:Uncharacterized protein n=1 Tax=Proteus phage vB_PmiM_Pm5461 TaxID=1636250 RepID=A0A0G2SSR5_9CAUD|nr:hypothetical protein AVT59_gp160 [Proteus phage vB_PmiM_Pm5461]AKA62077.1 hypothetical protein Pm5461_211 [Proteus phage vB_PmiM_Pm5461]